MLRTAGLLRFVSSAFFFFSFPSVFASILSLRSLFPTSFFSFTLTSFPSAPPALPDVLCSFCHPTDLSHFVSRAPEVRERSYKTKEHKHKQTRAHTRTQKETEREKRVNAAAPRAVTSTEEAEDSPPMPTLYRCYFRLSLYAPPPPPPTRDSGVEHYARSVWLDALSCVCTAAASASGKLETGLAAAASATPERVPCCLIKGAAPPRAAEGSRLRSPSSLLSLSLSFLLSRNHPFLFFLSALKRKMKEKRR